MKLEKLLAKIFVIVATFFVVLSPIALIEEADHHCNHTDDCPICEVIRTAPIIKAKYDNYAMERYLLILRFALFFAYAHTIYVI